MAKILLNRHFSNSQNALFFQNFIWQTIYTYMLYVLSLKWEYCKLFPLPLLISNFTFVNDFLTCQCIQDFIIAIPTCVQEKTHF